MSNDGNLRAVRALDMKRFLFVLVLALLPSGCVRSDRPSLALGSAAPDFNLPGVDGKSHTLGDFASSRVLAIVFTCNTCPTSQLYESRIRKLDEDYRAHHQHHQHRCLSWIYGHQLTGAYSHLLGLR